MVKVDESFLGLLAKSRTSLVDAYMMACAMDGIEKAHEDVNPHGPKKQDYVSF